MRDKSDSVLLIWAAKTFVRIWEKHCGLEKNLLNIGKYRIEITENDFEGLDVCDYFKELEE